MRKLVISACAALAAFSLLAQSAQAGALTDRSQWRPRYAVVRSHGINVAALRQQSLLGRTIPFFQSRITSPLDGKTYPVEMVGTNPTLDRSSTTIQYVPIALRMHFPDGTVLDPQKPGCNDTISVAKRLFNSPLFENVHVVSNGVFVGDTQLTDGFQRANFWVFVHDSNYHVRLQAAKELRIVDVYTPFDALTVPGVCAGSSHNIGLINIGEYDYIVQKVINAYAMPNQLPIVASYNVSETAGGCCILGYHDAYPHSDGTQTYAVGTYNDAGIFTGVPVEDIHAWSHEIGEWMDDRL